MWCIVRGNAEQNYDEQRVPNDAVVNDRRSMGAYSISSFSLALIPLEPTPTCGATL